MEKFDGIEISLPNYKWIVCPLKGWRVQLEERPNWWNRIWYRLIFGWKFEEIVVIKGDEY